MSEQKISTADILAKIRAEKQGAAAVVPVATSVPAPTPTANAPAAEAAPAPIAPAPKAAPPAAKPSSPADIMAAIRAQGAKKAQGADAPASAVAAAGDASAAKAAPAAKPAAVAVAASDGPKLSVEEMLKAVRGETALVPAAAAMIVAPAKPALPPMPVKPVAAKDKKAGTDRRSFIAACLSPLAIAWSSMAATSLVWLLDLARFMFPNVLVEPPTKFKIGSPSDYPLGTVSTKWLAARGVWIVHTDQYKGKNLIYALASVCTHLGCTPNWLEGEQKYKCPCHGSGFYVTGVNFEGPAPRPLERVGIRVAPDGMLEVDKSVKFQEEMGQWQDPNSFVDATLA